jgi:hypothetical protein
VSNSDQATTVKIHWTILPPERDFIGPPCPDNCEAGMFSHVWMFRWDAIDGASIYTDECPICNRSAQLGDYPSEYLSLDEIPVRLEGFTEVSGYESPEYDHYVAMTPVLSAGSK